MILHDLNKIGGLANWRSEELADGPYIQLVNTHLTRYRDIKGVSKAAHEQRDAIAEDYLRELTELLQAMIRRKELVRLGTEEALREAE